MRAFTILGLAAAALFAAAPAHADSCRGRNNDGGYRNSRSGWRSSHSRGVASRGRCGHESGRRGRYGAYDRDDYRSEGRGYSRGNRNDDDNYAERGRADRDEEGANDGDDRLEDQREDRNYPQRDGGPAGTPRGNRNNRAVRRPAR